MRSLKGFFVSCLTATVVLCSTVNVAAADFKCIDTKIDMDVKAVGQYVNWDGVSTVAQFADEDGDLCFAYVDGKYIKVVKTDDGEIEDEVFLKMKAEIFGTVVCDEKGNFYAVTGRANTGSDRSKNTIYITKYNKNGKYIKVIGNDGRSSLASYYDNSYNTAVPFEGGTCDAAVNGRYLAVDYGRHMYSGHQSNSVWMIDTEKMKTVKPDVSGYYGYKNYQSHSFGQRVTPFEGGFAFMSEGDCYDRCFKFSTADLKADTATDSSIFNFYVEKGAFDSYNMTLVNNNFAHIGNICDLGNGKISFVASSVKSMNKKANDESEQLFIQIFDPKKDLSKSTSYVTKGERSGTAGKNGDEKKKDYGVKWLTDYKSGSVKNPQAVADEKGNTIVLFEKYKGYTYLGVYSIKVSPKGNVLQEEKRLSADATLNSCETPIYDDGYVYWCANEYFTSYGVEPSLYIYKLKV